MQNNWFMYHSKSNFKNLLQYPFSHQRLLKNKRISFQLSCHVISTPNELIILHNRRFCMFLFIPFCRRNTLLVASVHTHFLLPSKRHYPLTVQIYFWEDYFIFLSTILLFNDCSWFFIVIPWQCMPNNILLLLTHFLYYLYR